MTNNLILTGVPRSGTTLCCKLLGQASQTVALVEPMPVHQLALQPAVAVTQVQAYFQSMRTELLATGRAEGQQQDGSEPDNFFDDRRDATGLRVRNVHWGTVHVDKSLSPNFTLCIKHNAAFTALLPTLSEVFECVAVVRNPLSVLASWQSVDLPVARGRLPAAERLLPVLAKALDDEPDVLQRQLLLLDWLFDRFVSVLPASRIVRYEEIVASGGGTLARATGIAIPQVALGNRNASGLYDAVNCVKNAEAMLARSGAWLRFYDIDELQKARDAMRRMP